MFCSNCGSRVNEKQAFCGKCGKAIVPVGCLPKRESGGGQAAAPWPSSAQSGASSYAPYAPRKAGKAGAVGKRLVGKRGNKLAAAAVSCLVVAGLVVGGVAGHALNVADGSRTQQQAKTIATQVVNSAHAQEQVSVSARNAVDSYSWEELATISDAIAVAKSEDEALEIAKDFNLVGPSGSLDGTQAKTVRLNSGAVAKAQIIGFSHDVRDGGGKAGITFMFKDCIAEHQLNASGGTSGGWLSSDLRHWMNGDLFYSLPGDLRGSIVAVCKPANNVGKTSSRSSVTTASDLLWTPSFTELVGYVDMDSYEKAYERIPASRASEFQTYFDVWNAEGSQYKLFSDCRVRMAKSSSVLSKRLPSGAVSSWWGRSASPGEWDRALSVSGAGRVQKSTSAPSEWLGVAPCFCVGRFGCGEARDNVPDYVDNSATYVNPVDVNYVYVNDDDSSTINVTYIDKSTNTTNATNNNTTNNIDNSVNVDADVDTSADVGDEYQIMPLPGDEYADYRGGEGGYSDDQEDGDYPDDGNGYADGRNADREDDPAGDGGLWPEDDDLDAGEDADDRGDYADDDVDDDDGANGADDDDESSDASGADRDHGSDGDADRKADEDMGHRNDADKRETIDAGDQQTLTGIIEVRHVGDHDATMLVLPAPITVSDPANGSATSDRIGLDSSLSQYEGKRVTLRCILGVNPDGQVAPNGTTRIYAKGAQVVNVANANGGAQADPDKSDDSDNEDVVVESPIPSTSSDVQGVIDKALGGELPFGL